MASDGCWTIRAVQELMKVKLQNFGQRCRYLNEHYSLPEGYKNESMLCVGSPEPAAYYGDNNSRIRLWYAKPFQCVHQGALLSRLDRGRDG
ncbi:hypothetical protein M5D96_000015 [Drosophila gunungcola]|uniref:Uncharacterized protein n=1 Tax=Drosophila gunungcola TaxID=103775 RepID=A0A9P9YVJ0_9MUSC|nr:hypothetical protein M5D96_000015 [Drosophila gunungcola]